MKYVLIINLFGDISVDIIFLTNLAKLKKFWLKPRTTFFLGQIESARFHEEKMWGIRKKFFIPERVLRAFPPHFKVLPPEIN